MAVSIPASLALLLVSWPLATALACRPAAVSNAMLPVSAGVLFAALGSLQVSELLGVGWRHPAIVLSALIAGFLATTCWLIDTCRGGESRQPLPDQASAGTVSGAYRTTASTRARNALLAVDVCVWTAAVGICLHFGWHAAVGMADWQVGLLLFVGFIVALLHGVLVDIRLPAG